ncbi:MAG: PhzF family phenazine biosynthesis isomerase [Pseudomonadales bacterium]|nr:PhzF family phenazine biosynthesis isomerase [Pseudomonadales bacterium]
MKIEYFTTDVFTEQCFAGAQIAVVADTAQLDQELMQKVANEFGLSETVFVTSMASGHYQVKVFNPLEEVALGSHTTVAAGYVLAATGKLRLLQEHTPVVFVHNGKELKVHISHESGKPTLVQFSMITEPIVENFVPGRAEFAEILGLAPAALDVNDFKPLLVSNNGLYLVVPIRSLKDISQVSFSDRAWNQSSAPSMLAQQILLFSTEVESRANFHLRLVGPKIHPDADPPVGSAMQAFSAYLCAHQHIRKGTYSYTAERGLQSTRQSLLDVEMDNRATDQLTVRVGGNAVLVCQGTMQID